MAELYSYPKVYALGHKAIQGIFQGPVVVEEKVDGSQFSFGVIDSQLMCRSKGQSLLVEAPEKLFEEAVETAKELAPILQPGWIYRGEYLKTSKHNTLAYDRVPNKHIVIFDIQIGLESYLEPDAKRKEAERLGLETVPRIFQGSVVDIEIFKELLEVVSFLGGQKVEGVVVKNYDLFTLDGKIAIGKYVSEKFKEIHGGEWRKNNPPPADIVDSLIQRYRTPARWQKAIQHMVEAGRLEGSPRDIGLLMGEVPADIQDENEGEIKQILFDYFWPKIRRGVTSGLPEWYKEQLLEKAFDDG